MSASVTKGAKLRQLYGGKTRSEAIARALSPDAIMRHLNTHAALVAGHEVDQAAAEEYHFRRSVSEIALFGWMPFKEES